MSRQPAERRQCATDIAKIRLRLDAVEKVQADIRTALVDLDRRLADGVEAPLAELIELSQWTHRLRAVLCPLASIVRRLRAWLLWIAGTVGALAIITEASGGWARLVAAVRKAFGGP